MFSKVVIKGKTEPVQLLSNAATAYRYKQVFKRDLIKTFMSIDSENKDNVENVESINTIQELAFIMNAQAERKDMRTLNYDDYINWLEQFEGDAFFEEQVNGTVINTWIQTNKTTSNPKKE